MSSNAWADSCGVSSDGSEAKLICSFGACNGALDISSTGLLEAGIDLKSRRLNRLEVMRTGHYDRPVSSPVPPSSR